LAEQFGKNGRYFNRHHLFCKKFWLINYLSLISTYNAELKNWPCNFQHLRKVYLRPGDLLNPKPKFFIIKTALL